MKRKSNEAKRAPETSGSGTLNAFKRRIDARRRLLDLALAATGAPSGMAISAVVAAALIANGEPQIFEREQLVGRDARLFTRLRFKKPARIKRLGWLMELLKRTHAYDVPVLLNIIKGEMAFVGPEALSPEETAKLEEHDRIRLAVRPGLSDPYRIRKRMNIAFDGRRTPERAYLAERSVKKDLAILARTIPTLIMGGSTPVNVNSFVLRDVEVSNLTLRQAVEHILALSEKRRKHITFVNPHCFNVAAKDADYQSILKRADAVFPDGVGVRLAGSMIGAEVRENVNGTDLFPILCDRAQQAGKSLFLLGAAPGVSEVAKKRVLALFPDLKILGAWHGFFEEGTEEEEQIISAINHMRPDLLLVARGVPTQEKWIERNLPRLNVGVAMGVGGLFDFYSGRIPRAPIWVRELGFEWLWRFGQEPRRMFRRYLVGNPQFLWGVWRWYVSQARTQLIKRFSDIDVPSQRYRAELRYQVTRFLWFAATEGSLKAKRLLDIIGATSGLALLSPLFLATALAIKIEDAEGPVFFGQNRVGRHGRVFKMYKFRSMVVNADALKKEMLDLNESDAGVIFKMARDPRITKVGRLIRRLSIDELPQLFNVFLGDMSLVGPRPPTQDEVREYAVSDRDRLEIMPGLTCLWQVSGRSLLGFDRQVLLDREYMRNQSFWGDIRLILRTIPAVMGGRGAF